MNSTLRGIGTAKGQSFRLYLTKIDFFGTSSFDLLMLPKISIHTIPNLKASIYGHEV